MPCLGLKLNNGITHEFMGQKVAHSQLILVPHHTTTTPLVPHLLHKSNLNNTSAGLHVFYQLFLNIGTEKLPKNLFNHICACDSDQQHEKICNINCKFLGRSILEILQLWPMKPIYNPVKLGKSIYFSF